MNSDISQKALGNPNLRFRREGVKMKNRPFFGNMGGARIGRWEELRLASPRVGVALEGKGKGCSDTWHGRVEKFISPWFFLGGGGGRGGV